MMTDSDGNGNDNNKGVELGELLSRLLSDDALTDLTLQGKDGVQVRVNRSILAARSNVFRQMFYGGFNEASSEVVNIDYDGIILKAIVEFIHTDKAKMLGCFPCSDDYALLALVTDLVSLDAAASFFHLPCLSKKIQNCALKQMEHSPSFSLALLDACRLEGPAVSSELAELALWWCRTKIHGATINAVLISNLSPSIMEEIVQDEFSHMKEVDLFQLVQLWVNANELERKEVGTELLKSIRLEKISPHLLSSVVESSGLVSSTQLLQAYKAQALLAEENYPEYFDQTRFQPVWRCTADSTATFTTGSREDCPWISDHLRYEPMKSGVYQWMLEISPGDSEEPGDDFTVWYGVEAIEFRNGDPQNGSRGWSFNAEGPNDTKKVTVTIDLRPGNPDNGTLTSSLRNQVLKNLMGQLEKFPEGFAPCVTARDNARVTVLNITRLEW